VCHFIPCDFISALKNPGVEHWKSFGLTLHGNLCGILGPTPSEVLALKNFLVLAIFQRRLTMQPMPLYFWLSKPASSHLVRLLVGQINPFPDLNIHKKKQTQKQDPHIHPRPTGNETWGYTKEGDFIEPHCQ